MYTLVDDSLIESLASNEKARGDWLFLEPHEDFPGQWRVNCFDPHYFFDFKDVVGPYRVVSPATLEEFMEAAKEHEYKVAFFEDPTEILKDYEALHEAPDVTLASSFKDTINGFLPFQVHGYNMLKDGSGVALWDTGTGKTVLVTGLLKHHIERHNFDAAFVITKKINKVNTQRKLAKFGGIDAEIIPSLKTKKLKSGTYFPRREFYERSLGETDKVCITHYETFRTDVDDLVVLFHDRRILIIWDEMPTKLKTRTTELYEAVKWCLFDDKTAACNPDKIRPSWLTQYMLSATPIENSPEDWFNCIRLIDPTIYGNVKSFRNEFVASYDFFDRNKPDQWHKLDKMGLMAAHITHQVDKTDPEVAKFFPDVVEEPFYCEWTEADRKLYNEILSRGRAEKTNALALISLLQMVCDEPSMLANSAALYEAFEEELEAWADGELEVEPQKEGSEWALKLIEGLDFTNPYHGKQEALEYLLCDKHRGEKTLVFSTLNESLMPTLEARLTEWKIPYVRYNGTEKQRQAAEDRFMEDPNTWVFLSSDMGSDSLDLYVGQNVINYNLPPKWSTKIQRQNRINRASSEAAYQRVYTLMYPQSIEERKAEIIDQKKGYHEGVFKGSMKDQVVSANMTKEDLLYILGNFD